MTSWGRLQFKTLEDVHDKGEKAFKVVVVSLNPEEKALLEDILTELELIRRKKFQDFF